MQSRTFVLVVVLLSLSTAAFAQVPLDGYFIARKVCPATKAIQSGANPGNVKTAVDHAYDLVAKNAANGTHFLISIPSASPAQRWVTMSCGEHVVPASSTPLPGPTADSGPTHGSAADEFVLALSWQPAFCETKPSKPECTSMNPDRFDASNLALHGLWPQPQSNDYCGIPANLEDADEAKEWSKLDEIVLSTDTRTALDQAMPGTQSLLERHEWTKHGSCYLTGDPEVYFRDSLALLDAINQSKVGDLFRSNIGKKVKGTTIRAAFDEAFGAGSGARVEFTCKKDSGRDILTEMQIHIKGTVGSTPDVAALIAAAATQNLGCGSMIIDPVGNQ